ncbi:DUF799 domain-containing protein [Aestuariibacter halophilus]|uniref:DUF799 domain-containing protein n=1 Tax=Fluctibacter halophilus TaxID=226011 RepID=A0ABS8G8N5_9ALTE|nr:DUF799 domain-containing protein [Aestuariibacter halophilus]MCC2616526.1 DUF799 domain-containing protein [Aestuariibacter halophilus]
MSRIKPLLVLGLVLLASGCASTRPSHDYTAFQNAAPHSILVLPPINRSPEIVAPYALMAQVMKPISEAGYYTFPVTLVAQTFRNNGLTVAQDVHAVPIQKLREIFGADAALYMSIENYGTSYVVIASDTTVTVSATLVDLRDGTVLWQDRASASSSEQRGDSNESSFLGMLVEAAVNQVFETLTDRGFEVSEVAADRLLSADKHNGLLYGPRSPKYGQVGSQ